MTILDSRLNAYRPDLADARLKGQVTAERYVTPETCQIASPLVSVHKSPRADAMQLTQTLLGEVVQVFERLQGWAWVQLVRDGYVGYVAEAALTNGVTPPTHRVAVPSTFSYPSASIKTQPVVTLTLNAAVTVVAAQDRFSQLADGRWVFSDHLKPVAQAEPDFVAVAQRFLHVPYYWGGKSVQGLDCSGLVQLSLEAAGQSALRDSDMQEATLGEQIFPNDLDGLRRGDLVFWNGHVGIMTDAETLLHANGQHMMVAAEPLRTAVDRIAASYGAVSSIRRFQ